MHANQTLRGAWRRTLLCGAAASLACAVVGPVAAQEADNATAAPFADVPVAPEVVVSASRVPLPSAAVGSAVTVITGEEIENSQAVYVSDVLREVPGVDVSRTGGFGGLTQVRIRGAEGNHTLVLIDGMEVGDPFNGSEFDFSQLLTNDIERIEVIRGPQSALFGSEAIGGVISIVTKRAEPGFHASVGGEGGSFSTKRVAATANAGMEAFDLRVGAEWLDTGGFDISPTGDENDSANVRAMNFRSAARPFEAFEFRVSGRISDRTVEGDTQEFTGGTVIDSDNYTENKEIAVRSEAQVDLFDGAWEHILGGAYTGSDIDRFTGSTQTSGSEGAKHKLDYQTNVTLETPDLADSSHGFTLFGEIEHETFSNEQPNFAAADQSRNTTNHAIVGEYRLDAFDRLFLSGSIRHDRFEAFEDATTYRVTGSFDVHETGSRLHASYGTGIKAPTFFELFGFNPGTFQGNPDLEPERSAGWDVGLEQRFLDDRLIADVTYFQADLEDEIQTNFAGGFTTPVNLDGESERSGVEVGVRVFPVPGLSLRASYTYLDAREPDGDVEVRRPEHSASFNANWRFLEERANLNLGVDYNGAMEDLEFASATTRTRVTLDDYTLVSLAGSYEPLDGIEVFGRVENALDQDYEEVFGFNTPGRAFYIGARIRFGPSGLE